jgi:hypothetical protein
VPLPLHGSDGDDELSAVRVFANSRERVLRMDLTTGEATSWMVTNELVTGLAVADDGVRVFVLTHQTVSVLDTHTGDVSMLLAPNLWADGFQAGPVRGPQENGWGRARLLHSSTCLIDRDARALLISGYLSHCIVRLTGIEP